MGRRFVGSIGPGQVQCFELGPLSTVFNPGGDWGALNLLAHPRTSGAELITFNTGKRLRTGWVYTFCVRSSGATATIEYDIDW